MVSVAVSLLLLFFAGTNATLGHHPPIRDEVTKLPFIFKQELCKL